MMDSPLFPPVAEAKGIVLLALPFGLLPVSSVGVLNVAGKKQLWKIRSCHRCQRSFKVVLERGNT